MSRYAGLLGRRSRVGACACGLLLFVALAAGASGEAPALGSGCAHANTQPGGATTGELRHAALCLINTARTAEGMTPLKLNSDLTGIAKQHTRAMLAQNCLKHRCPGELSLPKRLKKSGYLDNATKWTYAEDLGYESTPKQMVSRWLNTTLDARNLLGDGYEDVGIAPGAGAAEAGIDDSAFITYTIDLASRK